LPASLIQLKEKHIMAKITKTATAKAVENATNAKAETLKPVNIAHTSVETFGKAACMDGHMYTHEAVDATECTKTENTVFVTDEPLGTADKQEYKDVVTAMSALAHDGLSFAARADFTFTKLLFKGVNAAYTMKAPSLAEVALEKVVAADKTRRAAAIRYLKAWGFLISDEKKVLGIANVNAYSFLLNKLRGVTIGSLRIKAVKAAKDKKAAASMDGWQIAEGFATYADKVAGKCAKAADAIEAALDEGSTSMQARFLRDQETAAKMICDLSKLINNRARRDGNGQFMAQLAAKLQAVMAEFTEEDNALNEEAAE
jgi:hypothetical protein